MNKLVESIYLALIMMLLIYTLISWLDSYVNRVAGQKIWCLIDNGVIETTKEYKENPDKVLESKSKRKVKTDIKS